MRPLLDPEIRELWYEQARQGRPPDPRQVAELQYDIVVDWWHEEDFLPLCNAIEPDSFDKLLAAIEATRGGGKSTLVTFLRLYIAEYILPFIKRKGLPIRAENRNMVLFGRTEEHIRDDILGPVAKMVIERSPWLRTHEWQEIVGDVNDPNPEYIRVLSEMKSKGAQKWEALRLDFSNGVSIRTRTLRQSVRGLHVFYVDMDDPLTEMNAHESQYILENIILSAILPAIEPGGIFLLLGTPQMPGDLFDLVAQDKVTWRYSQRPAYDIDGKLGYAEKNLLFLGREKFDGLKVEDRACLWPLRLPYAALQKARGNTPQQENKYLREYLLQRITDDSVLVRFEDIVACRDSALSYQHRATVGHYYRGGIDPSRLKKDEAGFCVGYVLPDKVRVPAMLRAIPIDPKLPLGKAEMKVVNELNDMAKQYGCLDWKVESNGYQSAIVPLAGFVNASIRFTDFALVANKHTENGWAGLRTTFRTRMVKLPYATEEDKLITDKFVHQLRGIQYINGEIVEDPNRGNDLVSAFFLFLKNVEDVSPMYSVSAVSPPGTSFASVASTVAQPRPGGEMDGYEKSLGRRPPQSVNQALSRIEKWRRR